MIKDRRQKAEALRYVVSKRWFPQLEVAVLPRLATTRRDYLITDIDLLALAPDEIAGYRKLLFDCKSSSRESPMSRSLWLRGLIETVEGTRGICILGQKQIPMDHRMAAGRLRVSLFTEEEFVAYAKATGGSPSIHDACVTDLERWDRYISMPKRFPALSSGVEFSQAGFWLAESPGEACRKTIAELLALKGELDPAQEQHIALFFDLVALFLLSLGQVMVEIFSAFVQPEKREELAEVLLRVLYGGRDNYEFLRRIRKFATREATEDEEQLGPPNWDRLVQLVRNLLDSPGQALMAPLLAREVGWCMLGERGPEQILFAEALGREAPLAAKYCMLACEYLADAGRLPPEIKRLCSNFFVGLQGRIAKPGHSDRQERFPW